jgi:DNA-directed RNA polymerase specialized sigma24 family protein
MTKLEFLNLAYKKHQQWISIVNSFGCNPAVSEDIVQEVYIKLDRLLDNGLDATYGNEVNYFYVYKQLRGTYLNYMKQKSKINMQYIEEIGTPQKELEQSQEEKYDVLQLMKNLDVELEKLYWYDRKVFEIIMDGKKIAELSRETDIGYYSLYNTFTKTIKHLKNKL